MKRISFFVRCTCNTGLRGWLCGNRIQTRCRSRGSANFRKENSARIP